MRELVRGLAYGLALLLGVYLGLSIGEWTVNGDCMERVDTVIVRDTVIVKEPAARDSSAVRYVVRWLPVRLVDDMEYGDGRLNEMQASILAWPAMCTAEAINNDGTAVYAGPDSLAHDAMGGGDGGVGLSQTADSRDPPDNAFKDSIPVILPITQKHYKGEAYEAWVSGYEPRLDSLQLYECETVVDRERIYTPKKRRRRWGVVAGIGYGAHSGGLGPMAGLTIGYLIW